MAAGQPASDIRVLVVDDSVVLRRIVVRALERFPGISVAGSASNGRLGLAKIASLQPDVVVLDVEMPDLDGFGTLTEIRRVAPDLPVVLFSHVDERVAQQTLQAMSLGATDFVVKPNEKSLERAESYVAERLAPLLLELAAPSQPRAAAPRPAPKPRTGKVAAVVVGVSTGGPDALEKLVRTLPADLRVPLLIVQHMPPVFTRLLAERLDRSGPIGVSEAVDRQEVRPGHVYLAPGGRHLEVSRDDGRVRVALNDGPPVNFCRPAADVLFRSAVEAYGGEVLGVVLTGMGRDALRGCGAVREAGGQVVVQTPASAVIPSMPQAVVDAGLADGAVSIEEMGPEIVRRVAAGR
jgi:two-component system chemotaxis response regulator CheB